MKKTHLWILALAVVSYCAPAFAQHGHGAGAAGGPGMGMSGASHDSAGHAGSTTGAASVHGKTMDELLTQNAKLSDKIASLTGKPAETACAGFKNLGQCVAAAHVSKNLGISFSCLKSNMTGVAPATSTSCPAGTGSKSMSLGKSIQTLSPNADSKTEAKQGQEQANQDLKDVAKNS